MKQIIIWLSFLTATIAFANDKTIQVGLGELDYPPFYYKKEGKLTGAAIEISEKVAANLGYSLKYKRYPWKRVQYLLKAGKIEMMILYFKTPEREKFAYFTKTSHINESSYLFIKKDRKIAYKNKNLQALKNYRFGNVKGYSHGKVYDNADYLNKYQAKNELSLVKLVAKNRIDIGVGNKPALMLYAKQSHLDDQIQFLSPPIDKGANYFAFSKAGKNSKELVLQFDQEIQRFKQTKEYKNILRKYGFN